MNSSALLLEILGSRCEKFLDQLEACSRKCSEKAVHDLRVATRRLLAFIDLISVISGQAKVQKMRRILKKFFAGFDELRDIQVMLLEVSNIRRELPDIVPFLDFLKNSEQFCLTRVSRHIKEHKTAIMSKAFDSVCGQLATLIDQETRCSDLIDAGDKAYAVVLHRYDWMDLAQVASIHRVRISFKLFRYTVEMIASAIPDFPARNFKAMHTYQTSLGLVQDVEILLLALAGFYENNPSLKSTTVRHYYQQQYAKAIQAYWNNKDQLMKFWRPGPASDFPWRATRHRRVRQRGGLPASAKELDENNKPSDSQPKEGPA